MLRYLQTIFCLSLLFSLFPQTFDAQNPDTVWLCANDAAKITKASSGAVYDSGGPQGNYHDGENCSLLIAPDCPVTNLHLDISTYEIENCCDFLNIYDGENENAPLLGGIPSSGGALVFNSSSGRLFLRWVTDGSVTYSGFSASWGSTLVNEGALEAGFNYNDDTPALSEPVYFSGFASTSVINWDWNFGDGINVSEQNPSHAYTVPGNYTVQLIATNCSGFKDTVVHTITTQGAPHVTVTPSYFQLTGACGDTARTTISILNDGPGDLVYHIKGEEGYRQKILLYTYYADGNSLSGIQQILGSYLTQNEISFSAASDPAQMAIDLEGKDILIIPSILYGIEIWSFMSQTQVFQQFLADGGSIIVAGSDYLNYFLGATDLISSAGYYTQELFDNPLSFQAVHPITDQMPASYSSSPFFSGSLPFNDPEYVSLCDFDNQSVVGYKTVGDGNVIYLGFNFQEPDDTLKSLMINTLKWAGTRSAVAFSSSSGTIAAGDSLELEIAIASDKVLAGSYSGVIQINTNNPLQTSVEIPFDLTITGQAIIQPDQTELDFDTIMQFTTGVHKVIVANPGCDTLHHLTISSSEPAFTSNVSELTVAPFSADTFFVTFAPQDSGFFSGILALSSNLDTVHIPLTGYAIGAPLLSINPLAINIMLGCGESSDVDLTFSNAGLGNLNMNTAAPFSNDSTGPKILILDMISYTSNVPGLMDYTIKNVYPSAEIVHFGSNIPIDRLPDYMTQASMVILPALGGDPGSFYPQMSLQLKEYLNFGGIVLMSGTPDYFDINLLGISPVEFEGHNMLGNPLISTIPEHPLLAGINLNEPVYDEIFTYSFTSPNFVTVAKNANDDPAYSTVGVEKIGAGTFIYIGHELEAGYETSVKLLNNAIAWVAKPRWLTTSEQTELNIAPNESATTTIHLNTEGLNAGVYHQNIIWHSDDPAQAVIEIPVTLTVTGTPLLQPLNNSLHFGVIQQFAQKSIPLPIGNAGCDTLHILNVSSSNPNFQTFAMPLFVSPFTNTVVIVKFSPLEPGNQSGVITIETDGGIYTVSVNGLAVAAPFVIPSPASILVSLSCDGTETVPVTLNNTGLGNFNYEIGGANVPNNVAILNHGAEPTSLSYLRNLLNQTISNLHLIEIGSVNSQVFSDSLELANILLVPTLQNYDDQTYNTYAPAIQGFLNRGGQVLVIGYNSIDPLVRLGLVPDVTIQYYGNEPLKVTYASHPVVKDLSRIFYQNGGYNGANFSAAANVQPLIIAPNNEIYLGIRRQGQGYIALWGQQLSDNPSEQSLSILFNLFSWVHNPLPGGVHFQTTGGNIPAGGSQTINVQFDGSGIPGGTYSGQIRLFGNDPQHNPLIIPVELVAAQTPCVDFNFNQPDCSGLVAFSDSSTNELHSWFWQFGDGAEGFTQNPTHIYNIEGDYTVTLLGCNDFGCDTISKTLHFDGFNGPLMINCHPEPQGTCCGIGIYEVKIGTLDNHSGDGTEGYQDYSCTLGTDIQAGEQVPITVITGNQYSEFVRIWIDFNNNAFFNNNEQVFSDYSSITHEGFITIPNSAVKNVQLRMRVSSDQGAYPSPCGNLANGQAEDYYIIVKTSVATTEPETSFSVKLYPNPSAGDVWLEVSDAPGNSYDLEITDLTGRMMYREQKSDTNSKVKLPDLPAGTYLVKVQSGATCKIEKLIKIDRT